MSRLPSSFFTTERPIVAAKESLKDVSPIKWSKEVMAGTKKVIIEQGSKKK